MNNPYYDLSVPVFVKTLTALDNFLTKGAQSVIASGKTEAEVLDGRLAPDMFTLVKQIQIATDNAKGCVARLAGVEVPSHEDNETTIDELKARIKQTIDFISSLTPEQFAGAGEKKIVLTYFAPMTFSGHVYLTEFVLPNYFFHISMAYGILRMLGAEIGKEDFIGGLSFDAQ